MQVRLCHEQNYSYDVMVLDEKVSLAVVHYYRSVYIGSLLLPVPGTTVSVQVSTPQFPNSQGLQVCVVPVSLLRNLPLLLPIAEIP